MMGSVSPTQQLASETGLPPVDPPDAGATADDDGSPGGEPRWARPLVAVLAVLGLLLVGGAGGMLLSGSARAGDPNPVDIGFLQDMSAHHRQAVEMAAWERDHTVDGQLGQLALDIETTQNNQLGRMQGWLELWDAPLLTTGTYMRWMPMPGSSGATGMDHGAMTGTGTSEGVTRMPGMASDAELAAMRAAQGTSLDVLWLQLMLRHHEGGASMLQYAAANAAVPQVRNLASQMLVSQTGEIEYLTQLLTRRGGTPLPL